MHSPVSRAQPSRQPIRPGAVFTLGQVGIGHRKRSDITTVRQSGSPGFAQPASLAGRVKQIVQDQRTLTQVPDLGRLDGLGLGEGPVAFMLQRLGRRWTACRKDVTLSEDGLVATAGFRAHGGL